MDSIYLFSIDNIICYIKKGNKKGGLTKLKVVKNDREANQSISKCSEVKECNNFPSE